jgi:hypothetical protein
VVRTIRSQRQGNNAARASGHMDAVHGRSAAG